MFSIHRTALSAFLKCSENCNAMPEHFLLYLTLLENNRSAVLEATTNFASSLP